MRHHHHARVGMSIAPGPQRVEHDPDPDFVPRPVGFTADLDQPATAAAEPLVWDGDQG